MPHRVFNLKRDQYDCIQYFLQIPTLHFFQSSKIFTEVQFRRFFGVSPIHCELIWNYIWNQNRRVEEVKPRHLLFGLLFLKIDSTEEVHSKLCNVTRKTFRQHAWITKRLMADIKIVSSLKQIMTSILRALFNSILLTVSNFL